jgi:hypothetical protein
MEIEIWDTLTWTTNQKSFANFPINENELNVKNVGLKNEI